MRESVCEREYVSVREGVCVSGWAGGCALVSKPHR